MINHEAKRRAMSTTGNSQVASIATAVRSTVGTIGLGPTAMLAGAYYAHIRQMDLQHRIEKQAQRTHWSQTKRDRTGRVL